MAVAQHNLDKWLGPQHEALVPPEHRDRFRAIRTPLDRAAKEILRHTTAGADQTTAIKHLRYAMAFVMFDFIEQK